MGSAATPSTAWPKIAPTAKASLGAREDGLPRGPRRTQRSHRRCTRPHSQRWNRYARTGSREGRTRCSREPQSVPTRIAQRQRQCRRALAGLARLTDTNRRNTCPHARLATRRRSPLPTPARPFGTSGLRARSRPRQRRCSGSVTSEGFPTGSSVSERTNPSCQKAGTRLGEPMRRSAGRLGPRVRRDPPEEFSTLVRALRPHVPFSRLATDELSAVLDRLSGGMGYLDGTLG